LGEGRQPGFDVHQRKVETVDKLPSFREAFEKRRCVVPADGFYEWRGPKARREPLWIHPADDALLLFAGLFEAWQPRPGEWQTTFTILDVSQSIARADPQPHADYSRRGRRGRLDEFARARSPLAQAPSKPAPDDLLVARPASPLVNSVKNEGPELLEDLSLFGQ
jgi:putative SOS response-associated peptidase YedK